MKKKNNKSNCRECGKLVSRYSNYCHSCSQRGKKNHRYGKHSSNFKGEKYYCKDCNKRVSTKNTKRCRSCARKEQYRLRPESNPGYGKFGKLNDNYKTGYSINWAKARNKCFKRDNYICKLCNKKQNSYLNAHHIIHRNLCNDIFDINNLIALCRDCHFSISKIEFSNKYLKYKIKFMNYIKGLKRK